MASRIIITVYALEGSPKIGYAKRTLINTMNFTNLNRHELFISDNGSCHEMLDFYNEFTKNFHLRFPERNLTICLNGENLGTSGGLNKGLQTRKPNQFCVKRDDDTTIYDNLWIEKMEECFHRMPELGIVGAKRNVLEQKPDHINPSYRTQLVYLPHERGQTWVPIEICEDIIGTCTMYSPRLLDRVGGGIQVSSYGFDDVLWSIRSIKAGFINAFYPGFVIAHIDTGEGEFVEWKRKHAGEIMKEFNEMKEDFISGVRDVYHDPYD